MVLQGCTAVAPLAQASGRGRLERRDLRPLGLACHREQSVHCKRGKGTVHSSKERIQFFIHEKWMIPVEVEYTSYVLPITPQESQHLKLWGLFQVLHAAALLAVFADFVNSARFHKYPGFVYAYTLALVHCITVTLGSLIHRLQRMLRFWFLKFVDNSHKTVWPNG